MQSKVFMSKSGAVATEHPLASLAALEVLKSGGNAVDASVTAAFCLAVSQPQLSGLGGDFFALYYNKARKNVHCLNSSGWSPAGLTVDVIKSKGYKSMPEWGPLSVVVPGHVKGVYELHKKFGKLDFTKLIGYSVKLAEEGFPVYNGLAKAAHVNVDLLSTNAKKTFAPNGKPLQAGQILTQKSLAKVLRTIADEGPSAFYEGWIAEKIIGTLKQDLSINLEDFSSFEPEWCQPIKAKYRDAVIYEVPPNSMGATTLLILKSLESIQLNKFKPDSQERIKSTLKVVQESYARRDNELGDPRFVKFELDHFLRSEHNAAGRTGGQSLSGDTTYFAVVDAEGNMVSGIQSLFQHFGSKVFVDDCGFFLNNRAFGFRLEGPNKVEPRKRPIHTLSAVMVEKEGEVRMALGTSGGGYRPQQHALFITNLVDYSMNLEEALAYPRFLWDGRKVLIENGYAKPSPNYVVEMMEYPGKTGVAQGVESMNGVKKAVCDLRGDGIPMGF